MVVGGGWWIVNIHVGVSEVCSIRCRSKIWRWSRKYLLEGKEEEKKIELDRSMDGVTVDGERDRRLGSQSAEMPAKVKAPPT